jgi:hypothetical protein
VAAGVPWPALGQAASIYIGVQTHNLTLGITLGSPPPLGVVPGTSVDTAASLPNSSFVYQNPYYLYPEGRWLRARHEDESWPAVESLADFACSQRFSALGQGVDSTKVMSPK